MICLECMATQKLNLNYESDSTIFFEAILRNLRSFLKLLPWFPFQGLGWNGKTVFNVIGESSNDSCLYEKFQTTSILDESKNLHKIITALHRKFFNTPRIMFWPCQENFPFSWTNKFHFCFPVRPKICRVLSWVRV